MTRLQRPALRSSAYLRIVIEVHARGPGDSYDGVLAALIVPRSEAPRRPVSPDTKLVAARRGILMSCRDPIRSYGERPP